MPSGVRKSGHPEWHVFKRLRARLIRKASPGRGDSAAVFRLCTIDKGWQRAYIRARLFRRQQL